MAAAEAWPRLHTNAGIGTLQENGRQAPGGERGTQRASASACNRSNDHCSFGEIFGCGGSGRCPPAGGARWTPGTATWRRSCRTGVSPLAQSLAAVRPLGLSLSHAISLSVSVSLSLTHGRPTCSLGASAGMIDAVISDRIDLVNNFLSPTGPRTVYFAYQPELRCVKYLSLARSRCVCLSPSLSLRHGRQVGVGGRARAVRREAADDRREAPCTGG